MLALLSLIAAAARPRKGIELVGVDLKEAESVKCLGSVIEAKQSSREDMRQGQQGERKLGLWIKEKRLKVEAMGMTLAVTRRDRIRNEDVRSRVGVHEIVEEARMRWYGHIMRMEGEEDSKKINGYEVCREEMGGTDKCLGSVIEAKQSSREDMRQGQQGERKLGLWIKEKRLKVEAMGMTLAVTRRDRIRNEDVRSRVGVHEIVEEARMRWYGHIMRMEGEEDSKKINGYEKMPLEDYKELVGSVAGIATVGQMFSGVFICRDIVKQGSTKNIGVLPFLGGTAMSVLMLEYSAMLQDPVMTNVNIAGLVLNVMYTMCYYFYASDKAALLTQTLKAFAFVVALLGYAKWEEPSLVEFRFGVIVTAIMMLLIASPLFSLGEVIRTKSTAMLPFPLILSGTVVTFLWLLYGIIINNSLIQLQNVVGLTLCAIQLSLFVIYPSKPKVAKKKQ
uniref:Sugar transporter SWEET1 n=1 Tax=Timema genevievae TaxID=629358 RepID=A0A7R9JXC0_TIMGE|nr:unnamed protein product [Timema genevievae]